MHTTGFLKYCGTTMKFALAVTALFALQVATATPTPTRDSEGIVPLAKRATVFDIANLGYATQNGGQVILTFER